MSDPVEFGQAKMVSYGLMVKSIIIIAVSVFFATMVWNRFLYMEKEMIVLSERSDKRYTRQQEDLKALRDMVVPLQVKVTQE